MSLRNWHGGIESDPRVVVRPRSVNELVEIVKDRQKYPSPVRPFGSNHSVTECAVADRGTAVDMKDLNQVWVDMEHDEPVVIAQGGATYADVAAVVRKKGLQFNVNTEIGNVTMAAAAVAATKDASFPPRGYGQICSYIRSAKIVTPNGYRVEITDKTNPKLLRILRSSYGLLGIVYEVRMALREIRAMDVDHFSVHIDEVPDWLAEHMPKYRESETALLAYLFPYINKVVFETRRYTDKPIRKRRWLSLWDIRNWAWRWAIPTVAELVGYLPFGKNAVLNGCHRVTAWLLDKVFKARQTDPSKQILQFGEDQRWGRFSFGMWAFPAANYGKVLQDYFNHCRVHYQQTGYRTDLPHISYLIAEDQSALLSYSHDGDIWSLDPVSTGHREGWPPFLDEFNIFCDHRDGRPLFNQTPRLTRSMAQGAYGGRWQQFKKTVSAKDPNQRFLNKYFRNLL